MSRQPTNNPKNPAANVLSQGIKTASENVLDGLPIGATVRTEHEGQHGPEN